VLAWLREGKQADALEQRKRWPRRFNQAHWELLSRLQELQILQVTLPHGRSMSAPHTPMTLHFPAKGERQFLFGEWLEVYVAEEARATGLLDDVQQGVRFQVGDGYRELDFLGLYRGIPLLGSCKATRKPWCKNYLDELNAVADLMGGRYTWRFFFTDQTPPSPDDRNAYRSYQEFMAHAQRLRIRVITADLRKISSMLILNFAHPLTDEHIQTIEALTGQKVEQVIVVNSQIDTQQPLAPQVAAMADAAGLSPEEWQTSPLLIKLFSPNFSTGELLVKISLIVTCCNGQLLNSGLIQSSELSIPGFARRSKRMLYIT